MASTEALNAAAQDRKSRLAQFKSSKRKHGEMQEIESDGSSAPKALQGDEAPPVDVTSLYLSGRNYDITSKDAKLGFQAAPSESKDTLEKRAVALAEEIRRQREQQEAEGEESANKGVDLIKLQPRKANWDLRRELERRSEVLNVRTDNAIAKLVRERIANQQQAAKAKVNGSTPDKAQGENDGEPMGMEGATLVEATNVREREDEEEARREKEEMESFLDAS